MLSGGCLEVDEDIKVTGTLVWYYYICKRQVWLMGRNIEPEPDDNIQIGRVLHEESYSRDRHEISFHGGKVDILRPQRGRVVVLEIKKSSHYMESSRMQLAFYLRELEKLGLHCSGEVRVPEEKQVFEVRLDDTLRREVDQTSQEILDILHQSVPPPAKRSEWCRRCAYSSLCWA